MKKLLSAFAVAVLVSCSKNENLPLPEVNNSKIQVNELGMLKFSSHQHFLSSLMHFDKLSKNELENFTNQISKDFLSYYADTLDDNKNAWDFDPTLIRLINKDASIQIGDSILVFTKEYDYKIPAFDKELVKQTLKSKVFNSSKIEKIKVTYTNFKPKSELNSGIQKVASTSTSNYTGSYNFYTPEVHTSGRPERTYITLEERNGGAGIRFYGSIYGQAYRKGGLFGSKKWREDEIHNLTYDLIKAKNPALNYFEGPLYNLYRNGEYSTTFYSTHLNGSIHNIISVDYLDVNLHTIIKNGSAPTQSVSIKIDKYTNGQRYVQLTKSW